MRTEHLGPENPDHEDLESLVAAHALDALEPAEQEQVEAHLASCPRCRDLEDSLRETAADLSAGIETTPPPALRENIFDALRAEASAHEETPAPRPAREPSPGARRPSRRVLIGEGVALAASALVATGLVVARPWRSPEQKDIDEILDADDAQNYTATWESARVELVHSTDRKASVLEVEHMDPAPSGHDYQVWSLTSEGPASAGLLRPGDDGSARFLVPAEDAEGAAVSLEPEGGSEQPTTVVISVDYT